MGRMTLLGAGQPPAAGGGSIARVAYGAGGTLVPAQFTAGGPDDILLPTGAAAGQALGLITINNTVNGLTLTLNGVGMTALRLYTEPTNGIRYGWWGKILDAGDITAGKIVATGTDNQGIAFPVLYSGATSITALGAAAVSSPTAAGGLAFPIYTPPSAVVMLAGSDNNGQSDTPNATGFSAWTRRNGTPWYGAYVNDFLSSPTGDAATFATFTGSYDIAGHYLALN